MQAKMPPLTQLLLDPNRANAETGPSVIAVYRRRYENIDQPLHRHARGQAIAADSGLLKIETETDRLVVPPGHAAWLPPEQLHALGLCGQFSGWSIYVAPDAGSHLPARPSVIQVSGLLREATLRAATWSDVDALNDAQSRISSVILDEIASAPSEQLNLPLPTDRRLLKIAHALESNPADNRTLQEWATWAAIAPRSLTRRFVVETGMSFSAWRQRVRLMRALEMLAIGASVTTIAIDLNYDSLSAFIAMFKRAFGISPARYLAETRPKFSGNSSNRSESTIVPIDPI